MTTLGKLIGKGTFSKVYRQGNSDTVTVLTNDPVKECLSHGWMPQDSLFPAVEAIDYDEVSTYIMPYYPKVKAPKRELTPYSYELYKALRKYFETVPHCSNPHDSYHTYYDHIATIPAKFRKEKALLKEAFEALANYGSDFAFEISPRNISKTKRGKLVLLDCFFSKTLLMQENKKNEKKRSFYY